MNNLVPVEAVLNTNSNIFTGIKYAFKGRLSQKYLDGRDGEGHAVLVADRSPVDDSLLNWYIYPSDDNCYALRSGKNRCYLDGRDKTSGESGYFGRPKLAAMMATRKHVGDRPLQWSFKSAQGHSGYYTLKGRESDKYLNGGSATSDGSVLVSDSTPSSELELQWNCMPVGYKLSAQIEDFKYDAKFDDLQKLAKPSMPFVVWTMENQSKDISVTVNPNIHHTHQNYNSWTFKSSKERSFISSLEHGASVSAEFQGIGSRAGTIAEWSTQDSSIESMEKRKVDTAEISMTSEIEIPPRKRVSFTMTWSEVDVSVDYTATVRVTGFADRAKLDGNTATLQRIPPEATLAIMRLTGYDGEIVGIVNDVVTLRIKGVMHAKGAVNGVIMMSSKDI